MNLISYTPRTFKAQALDTIDKATAIIEEYSAAGYDLTLRQLYYQFVARAFIENTERSYKNLGTLINDARMAGLIDWDSIVDRTRNLARNNHWDSPASIIRTAADSYRIDKWEHQQYRIEVWIEKEALAGVLESVCPGLDVNYFSCRGYVSQSEQWRAAMRLLSYHEGGQTPVIVHLGDHDPSGIDMTRDIQDRMNVFGSPVIVERVALNMEQIEELSPPPNPAKLTDSRASGYVQNFGYSSWELDALEPQYISDLITRTVGSMRDDPLWDDAVERENTERKTLRDIADYYKGA